MPSPSHVSARTRMHHALRLPWRRGNDVADTQLERQPPEGDAHAQGWVRSSLRSVYGLLHASLPGSARATLSEVERVRQAMLEAVHACGPSLQGDLLAQRLRYAHDLRGLWYLRSDLLVTLAQANGEEHAHLCVGALSLRFRGLLPEAASYRWRRPAR